jgi:hypothetical protein
MGAIVQCCDKLTPKKASLIGQAVDETTHWNVIELELFFVFLLRKDTRRVKWGGNGEGVFWKCVIAR